MGWERFSWRNTTGSTNTAQRETAAEPEPQKDQNSFRQWIESDDGKETLQELVDALSVAFERLQASGHPSRTAGLEMAWRTKLQVLRLLGKDPKQDDQLIQHLRKRVDDRLSAAEAENAEPPAPLGPSEIALLAEVDSWDALPAEVLLDPLFAREMQSLPDDALGVMKRIAEAQPEQLAQETIERLIPAVALASKGARALNAPSFYLESREKEWEWVIHHLREHAGEVQVIDRSRWDEQPWTLIREFPRGLRNTVLELMKELVNARSGSEADSR